MFGQFAFNAQKEANKALKKLEEKTELNNTKGYNSLLLESKFEKDLLFFSELGKKVIQENHIIQESAGDVRQPILTGSSNIAGKDLTIEEAEKETSYNDPEAQNNMNEDNVQYINESNQLMEDYYSKLQTFMESAQKMCVEANVEPKLLTPALEENSFNSLKLKELTESQVYEIYSNHLEDKIKKDIAKPIFEGTFNSDYNEKIKYIIESIVQSGVKLTEESTEYLTKYAIFENSLNNIFQEIVFPRDMKNKIDLFESCQDPEYFEMFPENISTLKTDMEDSSLDLASTIAPKMFADAIGASSSEIEPFRKASKIIIIKTA